MVAGNPERNRDAVARGCLKLLQARCGLPAQHELAARIIEGRKKMVEESGPKDTVDTRGAEALRELAQGEHRGGQILYRPIAYRKGFYPPLLNLSMLAAGESAL